MQRGRHTTINIPEDAALDALLASLHHPDLKAVDLSLERIARFLAIIGHPERGLPPVIHVAGTNGKGSLLAFLHAILEAAGYTAHRYISPHLVRFNERILLQGRMIETSYLVQLLDYVKRRMEEENIPLTYFEATTVAAFLAFADAPADAVLLETGMGGRLDATNLIEKPALTAITPISLDHADFLGTTLQAIAREKAGILKSSVICVVGPQPAEATEVIERIAKETNTPLCRYNREWEVKKTADEWAFQSAARRVALPSLPLPGEHQYYNAGTAVACINRLEHFAVSEAHILHGLAAASWPARLQRLEGHPLSAALPPGSELWLDGGHNPAAGEVLAQWLSGLPPRPVHLVSAMLQTKDSASFLTPLAPYAHRLYAVPMPAGHKSRPPEDLAALAESCGIAGTAVGSAEEAMCRIANEASQPVRVLICGSLYLAGEVLALQSGTEPARIGA